MQHLQDLFQQNNPKYVVLCLRGLEKCQIVAARLTFQNYIQYDYF